MWGASVFIFCISVHWVSWGAGINESTRLWYENNFGSVSTPMYLIILIITVQSWWCSGTVFYLGFFKSVPGGHLVYDRYSKNNKLTICRVKIENWVSKCTISVFKDNHSGRASYFECEKLQVWSLVPSYQKSIKEAPITSLMGAVIKGLLWPILLYAQGNILMGNEMKRVVNISPWGFL